MQPSRPFYFWRIFLAFVLVSILFLFIFSFTYSIMFMLRDVTSTKADKIYEDTDDLANYLEAMECNNSLIEESSSKLYDVVYKMSILEREFGKKNKKVLEQKRVFSELQYQHMNLVSEFNEKCNKNYLIVYYFYSNQEDDKKKKDVTETISFILGNFQKKHSQEIMLYSLDYNLNSEPVIKLKEKFNISNPPVVVINNSKLRPTNIDELEEILSKVRKNERYNSCLDDLNVTNISRYNLSNKSLLNSSVINYSSIIEKSNISYNFSYDNISRGNLTHFEINLSENVSFPEKCNEFFNLTNLIKNYFEENYTENKTNITLQNFSSKEIIKNETY